MSNLLPDHLHEGASLRRVLITGIEGFTGPYLQAHLQASGYEVHGLSLCGDYAHQANLLDPDSLKRVLAEVQPNYVVHLAGIASPDNSDVTQIYLVNVVGTRNLLATLAGMREKTLLNVLLASSGNVYGSQDRDPLFEDAPLLPANDYAVSKVAMEMMAGIWADRLPMTIARPFNYTGRGQSEMFLIPKIVGAFRRRESELELGNTDVERDYSDVRDVVQCYEHLLRLGSPGATNICSGRGISLMSVLSMCSELTGHAINIRQNPKFVRCNEIRRLRGSPERIKALGVPEFRPFRETLAWMLRE